MTSRHLAGKTGQPGKDPLISVIVPVYNVAGFVGPCVESIRRQTLSDFEVIIIDDGSTDNSGTEAQTAVGKDHRFRLIQQENRGLSAARNAGLKQARGRFIAFVDSDDRIAPDYLMRLWQVLDGSKSDWAACAVCYCYPDGSGAAHSAIHGAASLALHTAPRRYQLDTWPDVVRHFPSAWNKLYRRSLLRGLQFDEGTWFEDHSFFYRVANRADHIMHLPEPLYLQTRGRAGQITASDDDRVFEQFDRLRQMREIMLQSSRPGAEQGFAQITSRLFFERSTALKTPGRRARFARACADFLGEYELSYSPGWDADIARSWALEMAGELPLSIVIPWDGHNQEGLWDSLRALKDGHGPGYEALIICDNRTVLGRADALATSCANVRTLLQTGRGAGPARNFGLSHCQGRYVVFLDAGDMPLPWAMSDWTESAMRQNADMVISQFRLGSKPDATLHNGFHDMRLLPDGTPKSGALTMTPMLALTLEAHIPAKLFRRSHLLEQGLKFTRHSRPEWALCIGAALLAKRVAYIASVGVIISDKPEARRMWLAPQTAFALLRGHNAATGSLPAAVRQALPDGWQRRLFVRAFWEQAHFGQYKTRAGWFLMLSGGVLGAALRGYGTAKPAGLDPFIGPRFTQLLNPLRILATKVRQPARPLFAPSSFLSKPPASPEPPHPGLFETANMFTFPIQENALLRFRADFHTEPYANISFLEADAKSTPFHLSVRLSESLVVCNDRRADGAWRAERARSVALHPQGADVMIELAPPNLRVLIDGREVFQADRRSLFNRGGFCNLSKICHFETQGGVRLLEVIPNLPGAMLELDSRLQLRAAGRCEAHCLSLKPGPEKLALIPASSLADSPGMMALLPGRLWRNIPQNEAMILHLTRVDDGAEVGEPLRISRLDMAGRIEAIVNTISSAADSGLILLIIEHVRHGDLAELLTPEVLRKIQKLASFYNISEYLAASSADTAQEKAAAAISETHADPLAAEISVALTRFAQSQANSPAPDPLLVLSELPLSEGARTPVMLSLGEFFCMQGRDFSSFAAIARQLGMPRLELPENCWSKSAILPFLFVENRMEEMVELLEELSRPGDHWVVTPAVAWVVRMALKTPDIPSAIRIRVLQAFAKFTLQRAPDYWERAHCRELTRTAAAFLQYLHTMPFNLRHDAIVMCLQVYGLSPLFWRLLDEQRESGPGFSLPAEIRAARKAFDAVIGEKSSNIAKARALHFFEDAGCPDAERYRREMFGPARLPLSRGGSPAADALLLAGSNPAEAALRHMACPGTTAVSPEVSDLVARALPEFYPQIPRAPYFEQQVAAAKSAATLLEQASARSSEADIANLIKELAPLSGEDSKFFGIGLGLSLVAGLQEGSTALLDWLLGHLRSLDEDQLDIVRSAPFVRMATIMLLRDAGKEAGYFQPLVDVLQIKPDDLALPQAPDNAGLPEGSPLFDVIVTVFSCRANLATRAPALRDGWLSLLERLGVPYVFVVGDGDGQRRGDVVYVDAPDDYEGLPQKTLATIRWVHDNTRFTHMLKIDDDCFLNAPLYFHALSYRKFDYYGRRLTRASGQTDRVWHQEKSTSARGRMDLDKSPEPSDYADGGSAYALSRTAMSAALQAADSPEGQQLIQLSFMEDKMLGDLLAMRGIHVAQEDYRIAIRRRTHARAIPVPNWLNAFYASRTAPLQLVHLDRELDQPAALSRLDKPGLWPRKIWPGYQRARLGYRSNSLELISSEASVEAARAAEVAVVSCMRNELFILPHFLNHYRKLGVTSFLIADNCSDDGSLEYLARQPDVALFSVDTDYKLSRYGVAWQQALLAGFRVGKWSLVADADEFLVWQENQQQTLAALLSRPAFSGANAARVFMLDMYPKGPLETATFSGKTPFHEAGYCERVPFLSNTVMRGPYSDQQCWTSALRHRLIPGSRPNLFVAQKLALLRYQPWMRLSAGLHFVGDVQLATRELLFAHFKYNASFHSKAQTEARRKQHFNDAEEYQKYLALTAEGRSIVYDAGLSSPWRESPFVQALLNQE